MKKINTIILVKIIIFGLFASAQEISSSDSTKNHFIVKKDQILNVDYKKINSLNQSIIDFSKLNEKSIIKKSDIPNLVNILKNLLELEKIDVSRDGVLNIADLYTSNNAIFHDCIQYFNRDDQEKLNEIFKTIENLDKNGNN